MLYRRFTIYSTSPVCTNFYILFSFLHSSLYKHSFKQSNYNVIVFLINFLRVVFFLLFVDISC
jgi:hypothetical protein